jgi:hypothetical protein
MAPPLPPLQHWGFGTSRWQLSKQTLHQACARTEGGIIVFLGPDKSPFLAEAAVASVYARRPPIGVKRDSHIQVRNVGV